jgi:hypothetical protein
MEITTSTMAPGRLSSPMRLHIIHTTPAKLVTIPAAFSAPTRSSSTQGASTASIKGFVLASTAPMPADRCCSAIAVSPR